MVTVERGDEGRAAKSKKDDVPARHADTAGRPKGHFSIVESLMQGYAFAKTTNKPARR